MMKRKFLFALKLCISCVLATTILSAFCLVYYNPPIATPQEDKYTNYKFIAGSNWANMTEGFGYGYINNIGYNNHSDYDPQAPTIAFIGSSHTMAMQVPQNKNFVSITQNLLSGDTNPDNDLQCINLGVSGHFFNICASNFDYFAEHYEGVQYAVMEVFSINYSEEQLDKILAGDYHSDMTQRGTLYNLSQRIPYLRLIKKQYQDLHDAEDATDTAGTEIDYDTYEEKLNLVMQKLADTAAQHGITLIMLYHHSLILNPDNTAQTSNDPQLEARFIACCNENQIPVIDMTKPMADHFENTYEPSYGFANTKPGEGHLNEVGHRLIAEAVYDEIIQQMEGR